MKRRNFLKDMTLAGLMLHAQPRLFASPAPEPDLALIQGESPSQNTRLAVQALGGMTRFISRGDRILIKPNIGWDRTPEQGACTNPEVVKALIELCFESGARSVKVMDNPCNPARRTYARSGIAKAAKDAGADVPLPNSHKLKKMSLGGEWLKAWEVYSDFVEADKIINVPVAKSHSLSRVTLGMKNWLGALGGNRNQLHQNLDLAVIDLAAFFKPVLTVLDAYRLMVRNGPQGGRLSDVVLYKTVAAGKDYVAVDAVGASFFDIKPSELRYLQLASERDHGRMDLEKIIIEKRTV